MFVWTSQTQSLPPSPTAGEQGVAIQFNNNTTVGTALSFTGPDKIEVLETGHYHVNWKIYESGYDSAFALFGGTAGDEMLPGSNYGTMSHDGEYSGQSISLLTEGDTLTLNRIDDLYDQTILNQVSGGTSVTGASIVVVKLS